MAIDPTIALKAGQVPQGGGMLGGIERGLKLQQLALQPAVLQQQIATARQAELASQAATRETEARLPGVQAEAAKRQREQVAWPAWLQSNGGRFIDPNTNTIDTNRLTEAALKDGFGVEALGYSTSVLGNIKQQIDNARSEEDRQAKLKEYKNNSIQTIGNFLSAAPEPDRLRLLNNLTDGLDKQFPEARIGSQIREMFTDTDRDRGVTTVNSGVIKAARTSGMTPAEQESNAREWAKLNPEFAATQQNIVPVEARIAATREAEVLDSVMRNNRFAVDAIPRYASRLKLSTRPGAIAEDVWNRYVSQDPEIARIQSAIDGYNARNPGAAPLTIRDGLDAVRARLSQENAVIGPRSEANRTIAERGTIVPVQQQPGITRGEPKKETPGQQAPQKQELPRVKTVEEARALPPGTRFIDPEGKTRIR